MSPWWLAGVSFAWLALMIWYGRMSYRHGIWDGAFNQFLPIVRKEMIFYDEFRARRIFEREEAC